MGMLVRACESLAPASCILLLLSPSPPRGLLPACCCCSCPSLSMADDAVDGSSSGPSSLLVLAGHFRVTTASGLRGSVVWQMSPRRRQFRHLGVSASHRTLRLRQAVHARESRIRFGAGWAGSWGGEASGMDKLEVVVSGVRIIVAITGLILLVGAGPSCH